ncbi:hypothetical protein [Lagierella sp.]|uniref:hypothetical protein n=1 Tax=Lagierella sp. TaxID=2849657 RepID=UPI0026146036|nr:hypothetical protein [Lagierella sp.]
MFDKLLRKMDQIKEEVFDEANKHMDNLGREVRSGVGDAITGKSSDIFSSVLGKVTDSLSINASYLAQTEKMANEKRAMELGISSRELMGLSTEEIASKYGMTVEEYHKKIAEEAKVYKSKNLIDSAKEVNALATKEMEARKKQASELNMTIEEFDKLTLQEQADKLNLSLDSLLEQRSLKF